MKTVYVIFKRNKYGMSPYAYSTNEKKAMSFADEMGIDSEIKASALEKVEHLLKQLKVKNLDK